MRKAGANWVEGDRFFDREVEVAALAERVRDATHTLVTAQRRIGKTSLVRELLRRLEEEGQFETVFVDLEGAGDAADAIAEIGTCSMPVQGAWRRIAAGFENALREAGDRIDEFGVADIRVSLRAGINAGNWRRRGDEVFAALAGNDRPVVLAIDELPILVDRLLRGEAGTVAPEALRAADAFLSWLRRNGQLHRGRVVLILAGSVSLEPILRRAGLSAHANIYSPYDLKPWDGETAVACLGALADTYGLDLPVAVRQDMCRRLRVLDTAFMCSYSSTACTSACAGRGGVRPTWRTWNARIWTTCSARGDRWTSTTTRPASNLPSETADAGSPSNC